ncbi:hypothetical protein DVH24_035041 [Malus domestica]|uniref:Uncharacterized protein n=1 Tax=Malus domestica TaxID=3750 RepID=A0A498IEH9_MALDO|nr:hypothetical protein DVH24_035041 [Malus domestica]
MEYNHQLTRLETTARAGIVLKCGPQARLCESLDTVVNLRYPRTCLKMGSVSCRESRDEPSSSMSSNTACNKQGSELPKHIMQGEGVTRILCVICFELSPSCSTAYAQNQIQWYAASVVVVPGPCSLSISLQTVQTLRWGCIPLWLPAGQGHVLLSGSNVIVIAQVKRQGEFPIKKPLNVQMIIRDRILGTASGSSTYPISSLL